MTDVQKNTIYLPASVWSELRAEGTATDCSVSELIRQAIAIRRALLALSQAAQQGTSLDDLLARLLELSVTDDDD